MKPRIYINDVAVRDGFQIEKNVIPAETKIALIDQLSQTGVAKIEVTAFVHPKLVPNMADAVDVLTNIQRDPNVMYSVLVPNVKGMERAIETHQQHGRIDEVNIFVSASETHNRANINCSVDESFAQFVPMVRMANDANIDVNGAVSTALGCPFEGVVAKSRVFDLIARYQALGVNRITLADTTGMANPAQVEAMLNEVQRQFPGAQFTLHFHNTRGMGLANVLAGIRSGVMQYDASLGGLGGCPFAPGATGNICTEDTVNMLHDMGFDTGVDLDKLLACALKLPAIVGHEVPGQVMKAGATFFKHKLG